MGLMPVRRCQRCGSMRHVMLFIVGNECCAECRRLLVESEGFPVAGPVRIPAETIAAYNATTYRVDVPGAKTIDLRIGVANPALSTLHAERGVMCSVFVTACNPFGAAFTDVDNRQAMGALITHLEARGIAWLPGAGVGNDGDWPPEPSVLALGINLVGAEALCIEFAQNAVVFCGEDATPSLVLHPRAVVDPT